MKIIEVRDGFIKFEANEGIYLSSFIRADGADKGYIAQVLQVKGNIAIAKILLVDQDGQLLPYDKTLPSADSDVTDYTEEIIKNSVQSEIPVVVAKTLDNKHNIAIDADAFNKKTIISVDDSGSNNTLIHNMSKQFDNIGKKTVIIDMLGIIDAKKYTAGVDFKLPLDSSSLRFLYEDCMGDVTSESKAVIVDIFKDLAEYSKTVPFVPFAALKSIVDNMVDKSHVFKLLVLKNKLAKLDKLGYFASKKEETDKLNAILNSKCSIIDLSKLDNVFQNRFLNFIYENIKGREDVQVILELSNAITKKSLKQVLTSDVHTLFTTHSGFSYLNDIKNFFDNFIIFPSLYNNQIFRVYSAFLKSMSSNSYLTVGEATNYMPFISDVQKIDDIIKVQNSDSDAILEELAAEPVDDDISENIEEDINSDYAIEPDEQPEVFTAIDEKSEAAINEITSDSKIPEDVDLFSEYDDEDEEAVEEISDEKVLEEDEITVGASEGTEPKEEIITEDPTVEEESDLYIEQGVIEPEYTVEEASEAENNTVQDETDEAAGVNYNEEQGDEFETRVHEQIQEEVIDISGVDIDIDDTEETIEEPAIEEPVLEEIDEEPQITTEYEDEAQALPLSEENNDEADFDEIVELDSEEYSDDDIIVDVGDSLPQTVDAEAEERIVQDVDKVFTTVKDEENISDSDLDFIDELNNDEEEEAILEEANSDEALLEELSYDEEDNGFIQEEEDSEIQEEIKDYEPEILEKREASTPIVPVYDADIPEEDMVESDPIQQGDSVVHAKYGNGIVEKMIKYGNKTLFSINFENVGRRLLDPTLTEVKKH